MDFTDLAKLDSVSADFAKVLFSVKPDWLSLARTEADDATGCRYFYLEVPSPDESDLSFPLWVSTDNLEVTVGIDECHRHFMPHPDGRADPYLTEALAFLEDLLSEKTVAVSWFDEERIRAGSTIGSDELDTLRFAGLRTRIRSWGGSFDKDVPADPKGSKSLGDNLPCWDDAGG